MFRLRFPESQLQRWADRCSPGLDEADLRREVRPAILGRGYLTRREFIEICAWKTARSKPRCARNDAFTIRTVSRAALASEDESLKIDLLRTLEGVDWPTASTLLHFGDVRPYPILDYRALWSLGYVKPPRYTTEFWLAYLRCTRGLARRLHMDIQTVDRALWQYAKEHQRGRRRAV